MKELMKNNTIVICEICKEKIHKDSAAMIKIGKQTQPFKVGNVCIRCYDKIIESRMEQERERRKEEHD